MGVAGSGSGQGVSGRRARTKHRFSADRRGGPGGPNKLPDRRHKIQLLRREEPGTESR